MVFALLSRFALFFVLPALSFQDSGDFFMMNSLYYALNGQPAEGITYLDVSIESHLMSFAAEESRVNEGATVHIQK